MPLVNLPIGWRHGCQIGDIFRGNRYKKVNKRPRNDPGIIGYMARYSSVSSAVDRIKKKRQNNYNFLKKLEQSFMCVCCQELVYQPVTTECFHNVCKDCLQRSFKAQVFSCPACRHDLGQNYVMVLNETLQTLLDLFFPGYSKGR